MCVYQESFRTLLDSLTLKAANEFNVLMARLERDSTIICLITFNGFRFKFQDEKFSIRLENLLRSHSLMALASRLEKLSSALSYAATGDSMNLVYFPSPHTKMCNAL